MVGSPHRPYLDLYHCQICRYRKSKCAGFSFAGLEQLQSVYGIPGNVSTLLELAESSAAVSQAVSTVVSAILSSHILMQPINFYANTTVSIPPSLHPPHAPKLQLLNTPHSRRATRTPCNL